MKTVAAFRAILCKLVLGVYFAFVVPSVGQAATAVPALTPVKSSKKSSSENVKRNIWSFGFTGFRSSLKADDGSELLGNSGAVQLGTGYLGHAFFFDASFDILLGPYEPTFARQVNVDYTGTGMTLWTGFSAQTADLRSEAGGYGFALGISYSDIAGHSSGKNSSAKNGAQADKLVDDYTMRVTNLSLLPAVYFSWLAPARPHGNTPELLATRVEGYVLTIGAAAPMVATYSADYTTQDGKQHSSRGKLNGYGLLLSLKAMLGT